MSYEYIVAAASGGVAASLRVVKYGWQRVIRTAFSGFLLAYFTAVDITDFLNELFGMHVSYAAIFFIVGYLGSELLDKAVLFVRAIQVSRKWKI